MRKDAVQIEEKRLGGIDALEDYPDFHERHRVFPAIFENRRHKRILDLAAGVGCAAKNIMEKKYPAELLCNDITPTCLKILRKSGLATVSFDLDDPEQPFPFPDGSFDTIVSLSTIEHMIHTDHFMQETSRILCDGGYLYISTPNYGAVRPLLRFLLKGQTFHDPLSKSSRQRYEFYAHVRYFTYRSLVEYVSSFGFVPETVYLALPAGSTRYRALSRPKALAFRCAMYVFYHLLSPRWAIEPIVCFRKASGVNRSRLRKKVM
jgi:SAM-dependent methyltransferase